MEVIVKYANDFWNLWLAIIFIGIVIYALWPTKKRSQEMKDAAMQPFLDDQPIDTKGLK